MADPKTTEGQTRAFLQLAFRRVRGDTNVLTCQVNAGAEEPRTSPKTL